MMQILPLWSLVRAVVCRPRAVWTVLLALLLAGPTQAQFVVDGRASASEIGPGKYQLVASYSGTHSVADRGLKSMYVARTATTLNIMIVASPTLATDYSSLVLYLNAAGRMGVPAGTRLAGSSRIESPLYHRPILDQEADYALRLTTSATGVNHDSVYHSFVDYTMPATVGGRNLDNFLGATDNQGRALAVPSGGLTGAKLAYLNTAGIAANTATGWEIEIPLATIGAQGGTPLDFFGAFTASNGDFTTDLFPQVAGRSTPFGPDPNFGTIAGTQSIRVNALTIDGRLDANEIGTGTQGLFQLVGEYTTPHPAGFGDYGFTKLYMANTATKLYLFVVGTVENNGNTFQLYFNVPGLNGVPRGTALPGGNTGSGTSFEQMRAKMDLETDLGLALQGSTPGFAVQVVRYAGGVADNGSTPSLPTNGTASTVTSPVVTQFNNMVLAYRNSPTGLLSSNPGNFGWEMEIDRAALGVPATLANATIQAFLVQNNSNGNYLASDMIPAIPGNGATNLGASLGLDFNQLPGRQALTYAFNCPTAVAVAYGSASYCQSGANPTPTATSPTGGSFGAGAGLSIDAGTGTVNLAASAPGTYTVSYNADIVNCPTTGTTQLTVTRPITATFGYGAGTYCASSGTTVSASLAANATAGTFTASPAGLNINASSGLIALASSQPGTYTITNTVGASGGCAGSAATAQLIVSAPPVASIAAGGPTTFCTGGSVTLTASGGSSYRWSTGATTASISVVANGSYSVTATSTAGCSAASAAVSVTVNPATTATFAYAGTTYCQSGPAPAPTITGTTGGTFSAPTALSLNATTGVINPAASTPGTYTVAYNVGGSCPSMGTTSVTITAAPVASFAYPAAAYCAAGPAVAVVLPGTSTAGTFSSTNGLSLNTSTGTVLPGTSTAGTYVVTNTLAASSGCAATSSTATIVINVLPTATLATSGATTFCQGGAVTLTAPAGAGNTYQFQLNGSNIGSATAASYSAAASGTYAVVVTNANGCSATSAATTVVVNPLPATPTISAAYGPTATTLASSATSGNQFYFNNVAIAGATGQTYVVNGTPTSLGSYTVRTTNANDCTSAASAPLVVTAIRQPLAGTSLSVYPNPTHDGNIRVELTGYRTVADLSVLNALGQEVFTTSVPVSSGSATQTVSLTHLPSGVYLLRVQTAGGLDTRRIVKE